MEKKNVLDGFNYDELDNQADTLTGVGEAATMAKKDKDMMENIRKGRPPRDDKGLNKQHRIHTYLNDDEYNAIKSYTEKNAMNISSFLRLLALDAAGYKKINE